MIRVEEYAEAMDCLLVLQVHDALVFEVPNETVASMLSIELHRIADEVNPISMPLIWESKYGI